MGKNAILCYETCNDYSCVRSGGCMGAGATQDRLLQEKSLRKASSVEDRLFKIEKLLEKLINENRRSS